MISQGTVEKEALTQFVRNAGRLGYRFKDDLASGKSPATHIPPNVS